LRRFIWTLCLFGGAIPVMAFHGDDVTAPKDWTALHRLIKPCPEEEKWLQIPWRTQLWEARQEAAAAGKPILLWEMDGHPLGCT
jgi:hypothetical protein